MFAGLGASCIFQPATGHEKEIIISPAKKKKKVLVIGGGPGGLEAARVAKVRGHDVVLFEKGIMMGGQFVAAGNAPHKQEFGWAAMHMGYCAYKAGVDIRLYTPATPERIKAVKPDVVIIATGSDSIKLNVPGANKPNVFDGRKVVTSESLIAAENVVVVGGGLVGLEAMEVLLGQGKKVTVVEMLDQVGKDLEMYIAPYMFGIIEKAKVPVLTDTKCVEIGDDYIIVEKGGKTEKIKCGAVVMAVGARSNTDVVDMVKAMGYEYHVVGDAVKPGKVLAAIWGGNEVARNI
jgi:NADPH-dependent 2,4-dienoyl-CoA reductase/sulfur reductase-like enzyme